MGTDLYGSGSGFSKLNTCGFGSGSTRELTRDVPYLQICAFYHHTSISKDIFRSAVEEAIKQDVNDQRFRKLLLEVYLMTTRCVKSTIKLKHISLTISAILKRFTKFKHIILHESDGPVENMKY